MKITKVEAIPIRQKGKIEAINDSSQDGVIIKVSTDEGIVGYGEVDSAPWVVKSIIESPASHRMAIGLAKIVVGQDPYEVEKIWNDMYKYSIFYGQHGVTIHAMSGIDIAIWDIIGKAENKPIWKLLGGKYRDKVKAYASTLMPYTPEEAYQETKKLVEQGYKTIKLGWGGFEQDENTQVKLVKAARQAAGEDVDLLFDIGFLPSEHLTIDAPSRIELVKRFEEYHPYAIEEPLWPHDYEGYGRLSENTNTRIVCGENETTVYGFKQLIEIGKVAFVQPDISRCGGFTQAKKIATLAETHSINVVPHCWSSGIVEAAALNLIAAIPNANLLEYDVYPTQLRFDIVPEDIKIKDGYAYIPDGPGLGITVSEEAIEKYRCDDIPKGE